MCPTATVLRSQQERPLQDELQAEMARLQAELQFVQQQNVRLRCEVDQGVVQQHAMDTNAEFAAIKAQMAGLQGELQSVKQQNLELQCELDQVEMDKQAALAADERRTAEV